MRQTITRYTPYDVKVYKCDYCGDEYKWKCNLKRHMKKKHDGHDGEIGLPTKAYTPGTGRKAVNEDNVVNKGMKMSLTHEELIELENKVLAEMDRNIELGRKMKFIVDKHGFNVNGLSPDMKDALKTYELHGETKEDMYKCT